MREECLQIHKLACAVDHELLRDSGEAGKEIQTSLRTQTTSHQHVCRCFPRITTARASQARGPSRRDTLQRSKRRLSIIKTSWPGSHSKWCKVFWLGMPALFTTPCLYAFLSQRCKLESTGLKEFNSMTSERSSFLENQIEKTWTGHLLASRSLGLAEKTKIRCQLNVFVARGPKSRSFRQHTALRVRHFPFRTKIPSHRRKPKPH